MRAYLICFLTLPSMGFAHIGHVGELAAHDHWVGAAAVGIALGVTAWGALKGKTDQLETDEEDAADPEEELAEA